jgi:probable addiction module antidote protein
MSEKSVRTAIVPEPTRRDIAERINRSFETRDITAIRNAIGESARLYSISDIAMAAGIQRTTVYRAFSGEQLPNFSTVLRVLDAMGFQLKVVQHRGKSAKPARDAAGATSSSRDRGRVSS